MSPVFNNGSSEILCFECSDLIDIHDGIMFIIYPRLADNVLITHKPPRVAIIEYYTVVHWPWQGTLAADAGE